MKKNRGKTCALSPTDKAQNLKPAIARAYKAFYLDYTGYWESGRARNLTRQINQANETLACFSVSDKGNHDPDI